MSEYLHYLHHMWFDPISAQERLEAILFIDLPLILLFLVVYGLIVWLKQNYYDD